MPQHKFKVGETVRVKDDASQIAKNMPDGWSNPTFPKEMYYLQGKKWKITDTYHSFNGSPEYTIDCWALSELWIEKANKIKFIYT